MESVFPTKNERNQTLLWKIQRIEFLSTIMAMDMSTPMSSGTPMTDIITITAIRMTRKRSKRS